MYEKSYQQMKMRVWIVRGHGIKNMRGHCNASIPPLEPTYTVWKVVLSFEEVDKILQSNYRPPPLISYLFPAIFFKIMITLQLQRKFIKDFFSTG